MATQTDRKSTPGQLAHEIAAKFKEHKRQVKTVSALSRNSLAAASSYATVQQVIAANKKRRAMSH